MTATLVLSGTSSLGTATGAIPIVMMAVGYDPVELGYVASLARPGGNITGVALNNLELTGKRLELLREMAPETARVIVFGEIKLADQFEAATRAAQVMKLPIKSVGLSDPPHDYSSALAGANPKPGDALFCLSSAFARDRDRLAALASL